MKIDPETPAASFSVHPAVIPIYSVPATPKPDRTPHLPFLDGLRGLAALYVLLYHCVLLLKIFVGPILMPRLIENVLALFENGHSAVCVFIVLSGYVLMLPLAFAQRLRLRGGITYFLKRRARRIFPPYYAALFILAALILVSQLRHIHSNFDDAMTLSGFVEHLFLIHNLSPTDISQIDPSMWSLGTEWQIYIIFAAILLPLSQRIGLGLTLLVTGVTSLVPHFLWSSALNGDQACPWFLILFQFGMLGAYWSHNRGEVIVRLRQQIPWAGLAIGTYTIWLLIRYHPAILPQSLRQIDSSPGWAWLPDVICGAATAVFLVYVDKVTQLNYERGMSSVKTVVTRIMQSRFSVWLGAFSYSLYLCHWPILQAVMGIMKIKRLHISDAMMWGLFPLVSIPLAMGLSYGFYWIFERPFVSSPTRKTAE